MTLRRSALILAFSLLLGCAAPQGADPHEAAHRPVPAEQVAPSDQQAADGVRNDDADADHRDEVQTDGPAGEVDYSCRTDADCEIKDVGNCCGYYPACVNRDSPTFPEQVRAACAESGMAGVCGFPALSGCRCVEQRCEGIRGPSGGALDITLNGTSTPDLARDR